jgi:hypothetical protein
MSIIRTGHTPGAWRDEGPAIHVPRPGHGIRGNTTSGFVPFVVLPIVQSDRERARTKLRGENLVRKERVLCGAAMRYEETCARMKGHRDSHRSRTVMDADRASRQASRRDLVLR